MRLDVRMVVPHGPCKKLITSVRVALLGKAKVSISSKGEKKSRIESVLKTRTIITLLPRTNQGQFEMTKRGRAR